MIRLLATLGSAALVIWGVDLALDTGSWREPAVRVGHEVADALELGSSTLDTVLAGEHGIATREEFEPDLGRLEGAVGPSQPQGEASVSYPEPASASERSRLRADEIRSRLDRVMDLARGPSP